MDRSNVIYLVSKSYTQNSIGAFIPVNTERMVYCDVRSITRTEWYDAGRQGFKPELMFVMFAPDYHGEDELLFNGHRYGIYRTYIAQNESIELYCEDKGGLKQQEEEDNG